MGNASSRRRPSLTAQSARPTEAEEFIERLSTVLNGLSVHELPKPSGVVTVAPDASLEQTFQLLIDHDVLSAPVERGASAPNSRSNSFSRKQHHGGNTTCGVLACVAEDSSGAGMAGCSAASTASAASAPAPAPVGPLDRLQSSGSTGMVTPPITPPHRSLGGGGGRYVGFVELIDLAATMVMSWDVQGQVLAAPTVVKQAQQNIELDELVAGLNRRGIRGSARSVDPSEYINVISPGYLARSKRFITVDRSSTLLDVCRHLAHGHHRLLLLDEAGDAESIISQSLVARFLDQLWSRQKPGPSSTSLSAALGPGASSLTITALGVRPRPCHRCAVDEPAIAAFKLMRSHRVSGVPVVAAASSSGGGADGSDRQLVGQVTAKDLRRVLHLGDTELLRQPLREFLRLQGGEGEAIAIRPEASVSELFAKFAASGSHRLFLVDADRQLIGIVSLKDALALILGQALPSTEGRERESSRDGRERESSRDLESIPVSSLARASSLSFS